MLRSHAVAFDATITASPDGHTLTVTTHIVASQGELSGFVYEKQD